MTARYEGWRKVKRERLPKGRALPRKKWPGPQREDVPVVALFEHEFPGHVEAARRSASDDWPTDPRSDPLRRPGLALKRGLADLKRGRFVAGKGVREDDFSTPELEVQE